MRFQSVYWCVVSALMLVAVSVAGAADVILNEYNAVRSDRWLDEDGLTGSTKADTFFNRVVGNGGDWFELIVVGDGSAGGSVDMTGWRIQIETDENPAGTLILNSNPYWSNVQNGTILTFIEQNTLAGGLDTGINRVNNFATDGYAWSNLFIGDIGTDENAFFAAGSSTNIMGGDSHADTQFTIRDAANNIIFGPAGEGISPDGGVGSREVLKLEANPTTTIEADSPSYLDGTSSSFGSPNSWAGGTILQNFNAFNTASGPSDLIWDATPGNATIEDGNGTWTEGVNTWFNTEIAGNDNWESSKPDNATFGRGAVNGVPTATIQITEQVVAGNLTFQAGAQYLLEGAMITLQGDITATNSAEINSDLELTKTGTLINVAADQVLTISGSLVGNVDFEVGGEGLLILNGDNSDVNETISITNDVEVRVDSDFDPDSVFIIRSSGKLFISADAHVGRVELPSGAQPRIEGDGFIDDDLILDDDDAKVRGNLTVMGDVDIFEGQISPGAGNSPGQLNFEDDLLIGEDVTYTWQLFDNTEDGAGLNYDTVIVGNRLRSDTDEDDNNNEIPIAVLVIDIEMREQVDLGDSFWDEDHQWTLIAIANEDNFTLNMVSIGDQIGVDDQPIEDLNGDFSLAFDANGNLILVFTSDGPREIPEPSSLALLFIAGIGASRRRWIGR